MRTRLPLLLALVGLLVAAVPALQGNLARDGKARAIEEGHLRVEQAQLEASMKGAAQAPVAAVPGTACSGGFAGPFPCENVDLLSQVPMMDLGGPLASDVWGWTDEASGREIVIATTTYGVAFVEVTDPAAPEVLQQVKLSQNDSGVLWRDVKVYEDHAYFVSEHGNSGATIFDLQQLPGFEREPGEDETFGPVGQYNFFGNAHNIAINEETGFAYAVGTNTCDGGLHMMDLSDPADPTFAGCFSEDGYTHDVQCVIYHGPDAEFRGSEICFAANEDTVTIVDVTDKDDPEMLSRTGYEAAGYTHQGWLTPGHSVFVFGDELDEDGPLTSSENPQPSVATYTMRVDDLRNPGEVQTFLHEQTAIDHNIYITDDSTIYQANYSAGLRVMKYTAKGLRAGELEQVAFFDVDPGPDAPAFAGAWTAYPFFESGTIAVNSFDSGLFLLKLNDGEESEE